MTDEPTRTTSEEMNMEVEELIGDMFDIPAELLFAAHPEARGLAERAVLQRGTPSFEAAMDRLEQFREAARDIEEQAIAEEFGDDPEEPAHESPTDEAAAYLADDDGTGHSTPYRQPETEGMRPEYDLRAEQAQEAAAWVEELAIRAKIDDDPVAYYDPDYDSQRGKIPEPDAYYDPEQRRWIGPAPGQVWDEDRGEWVQPIVEKAAPESPLFDAELAHALARAEGVRANLEQEQTVADIRRRESDRELEPRAAEIDLGRDLD